MINTSTGFISNLTESKNGIISRIVSRNATAVDVLSSIGIISYITTTPACPISACTDSKSCITSSTVMLVCQVVLMPSTNDITSVIVTAASSTVDVVSDRLMTSLIVT